MRTIERSRKQNKAYQLTNTIPTFSDISNIKKRQNI
jgi:hypothetical protein